MLKRSNLFNRGGKEIPPMDQSFVLVVDRVSLDDYIKDESTGLVRLHDIDSDGTMPSILWRCMAYMAFSEHENTLQTEPCVCAISNLTDLRWASNIQGRIVGFGYDARTLLTSSDLNTNTIASDLLDRIDERAQTDVERARPIFSISHSVVNKGSRV